MYDLKIVGGTIIDGTGGERYTGDIGIKNGKIVDVGHCDEAAQQTLDASGAIVTPGFVDIHTHYDGQISWDEELAPSSIHGVTTCAMGSCGVGFAPVRPTDHAKLIELMEGVEDIPGSALAEGIRWGWESFPEYMNALDAMPHTIDFLTHVPHDALRQKMITEKSDKVAGDGSMLPALADFFLENLQMVAMRLFSLGEHPNYEPSAAQSFGAEAMRSGQSVLGLIYDAMLEDEGESLLYFPVYNYTGMNLDVVHEMLTHPLALPGLSDGGAHVGTICDASFTTFLLTHWARDRQKDGIPLERVVQMQAHDTASFIGLTDRGMLAPGLRADVNIIDFDRLKLRAPKMIKDLPAGGQRLMQHADGYIATLVNGEVIAREGKITDARPGHLVRAGAQAQTLAVSSSSRFFVSGKSA